MQQLIPRVTPEFVNNRMAAGMPVHMLDVRSTREFNAGHARGALSLPMEQLGVAEINKLIGPAAGQAEPLYLICAAGFRAHQAAEKLKNDGLSKLLVIDGGTQAWEQQGLPMQRKAFLSWHFPVTI